MEVSDSGGVSYGGSARRGRWSVGAHLRAIVVAVVVVFGLVGLYSGVGTIRDARNQARGEAAFQADLASRAIADRLATTQGQITSAAASPGFAAVLTDPSNCTLTYSDLEFFPGGHLDLVQLDGRVACSSLVPKGAPAGSTYAGAPWAAELTSTKGPFISEPFVDDLTHRTSIVIVSPIVNSGRERVGAAVVALPLDGTADALAGVFAGPQHYQFAVTDAVGSRVLSRPTATGTSRSNPVTRSGVLFGSGPVSDRGWQVFAGVSESSALHQTYSLLLREGLLALGALVVTLLALTIVQRRIVRPLQQLTGAVGDASDHRADMIPFIDGPTEIVQLATQINETISARDAFETELSHQALHDPLTGLPNRALLTDRLAHALTVSPAPGAVGVLFIDLDHFKLINDSLGHSAGDQLLMTIGARLLDSVAVGATVARFGGDEFVVICEGQTDADETLAVGQQLGELIAQPAEVADRIVTVTASVGVAVSSEASRAEDLIREADTAMHVAKELGRARAYHFSEGLRHQVTRRLTAENELRAALRRNELRVVYQPIVNLASGDTVGTEALLRWDHPALGAVSPAMFIPIAEETGLIQAIGEFALEQACRQAATWREQGLTARVSVNVSGQQISDSNFADLASRILTTTHLPSELLCLELTESVLMSDATRTIDSLTELKSLGVSLSIDDFGTGYSSLAYLQQFPVDELKIDRAFINDLTIRPDQGTLVTAMVAMGKALGLRIVAEGVETTAQLNLLRDLGCDLAQGYLFAAPQTPNDVTTLLHQTTVTTT
jgi:diguanylate cyclase (GGDEF)-like protein